MTDETGRREASIAATDLVRDHMRNFFHRQVLPVPATKRSLFLAPHPDDIVLGCGGTVPKLLAAGVPCQFAYLTDGRLAVGGSDDQEAMAATREREAREVCAKLGVTEPWFARWDERSFRDAEQADRLIAQLRTWLDEFRPDAVFVPYLHDQHADHRYTNHLLSRALEESDPVEFVYGYEVWSFAPPTVVIETTETIELKRELMQLYASQTALFPYLEFLDQVGRSHAFLAGDGATHAEVFHRWRADTYRQRVPQLDLVSPHPDDVLLTPPDA